jgi:membrane-associated protease RseP (regulator of RpoE activity)
VLNLVPIPPFDGGAVVMLFLPEHLARGYQRQLLDPNAQMIGQLVVFWLFAREVAPRVCDFALWCVFA